MSVDLLTGKQSSRNFACEISGFGDEARAAVEKAPGYFMWWYTAKSIGLGVAVGVLGFMFGRASCKKSH
jgi:hypothetical protein